MRNTLAFLALAVSAIGQAALLHDNGAWITYIGAGFGGADVSHIAVGGTTFGSNINQGSNFALADDFTVPAGFTWTLNSLTFYTYQTQTDGVPNTTSTITAARFGLFNAAPVDATTGLVAGSLASDATITSNAFSGVYRTTQTTPTNSQRAVMKVTVDLGGVNLGPGTYWIAWSAAGSGASGPWGVPLSPFKSGANAVQWNGTAWNPTVDTGASLPNDYAFELDGTAVPEPTTMLALGGALAAFARRRRK